MESIWPRYTYKKQNNRKKKKQLLFLVGYWNLTSSTIITLLILKTHLRNGLSPMHSFCILNEQSPQSCWIPCWDVNAVIHWLKGSKTGAEGCIRITSDYVLPRLYQCCNRFLLAHRQAEKPNTDLGWDPEIFGVHQHPYAPVLWNS